jgi:hypothetical protein
MGKIFNSASKIVFILMALAVIGATFTRILTGEQFLQLASMAFVFYFSKNQPSSGSN